MILRVAEIVFCEGFRIQSPECFAIERQHGLFGINGGEWGMVAWGIIPAALAHFTDGKMFLTSFSPQKIRGISTPWAFFTLYINSRTSAGTGFILSPFKPRSSMAPAMMGNVCVWKPSTTAIYSNYFLMKVFKEAGLPDGVVNFIPGKGSVIGKVVTTSPDLAGFHFTGSTETFKTLWREMGENLGTYKSYPKIVGETGGKNFIFVHPSASAADIAAAIVRGAFEYQGQKCSAGSRAYIPKSLWKEVKERVGAMMAEIKMGDVQDFSNFINAVIDEASFDNIMFPNEQNGNYPSFIIKITYFKIKSNRLLIIK